MRRDIVAIDEIKKDREMRLAELRTEYDLKTTQYEKLNKEHAAMKIAMEATQNESARTKDDY